MKLYRYYIPPSSKLPAAAGIFASLLCCNTIYTLLSVPGYTQYWDYWCTLISSAMLGIFCFVFGRRRPELLLFPLGIFAVVACITPNFTHWMQVGLFFLFLLPTLIRLPKWISPLIHIAALCLYIAGIWNIFSPMFERIITLADSGRATASFVVPFIIRTTGHEPFCLTAILLLVFSIRPHILPFWMDEQDHYDRIWE